MSRRPKRGAGDQTALAPRRANLRAYISKATHEFMTALANIRGEIELGLMQERSAADYRALLEQALEQTDELARVTRKGFLLASLACDQTRPPAVRTRLSPVVEDTLRGLSAELRAARQLCVEIPDDLELEARPDDLRYLLKNLLDNALEHSPPGASIGLRAELLNGTQASVRIIVEDSGPGIPPALRPRLFEPFARGAEVGGAGRGLGLAIAREVARGHGGSLVLDECAKCTRFVATLPVRSGRHSRKGR